MTSEEPGSEGGYLSDADSVCSATSSDSRQAALFVCERCRALAARAAEQEKSDSELEEERYENESRCAKFLMDGDYKCQCGDAHDRRSAHARRKERHKHAQQSRTSASTVRVRRNSSTASLALSSGGNSGTTASSASDGSDIAKDHGRSQQNIASSNAPNAEPETPPQDHLQPPGIIPMTECAICLESYKFGVLLCGLPCGHAFHQHCIMGWLQRDNHCCPVCRWPPYKAKPCSLHAHIE